MHSAPGDCFWDRIIATFASIATPISEKNNISKNCCKKDTKTFLKLTRIAVNNS